MSDSQHFSVSNRQRKEGDLGGVGLGLGLGLGGNLHIHEKRCQYKNVYLLRRYGNTTCKGTFSCSK